MSSFADTVGRHAAVLDASVLINFLAMKCSLRVLQALGCCGVVPQVRAEVKRCPLTRKSLGDRWSEPPLSILSDWQLDDDGYELYVDLHVDGRLGKGEAASLAYACRQHGSLLCDDTAVPLVIERRGLDVPLLTTLDILRKCVDAAVIDRVSVRDAIVSGLVHSKMATPSEHAAWLQELEIDPSAYRCRLRGGASRKDEMAWVEEQGTLDFKRK